MSGEAPTPRRAVQRPRPRSREADGHGRHATAPDACVQHVGPLQLRPRGRWTPTTERPILQPWLAPGFPISSGSDDFGSGPKPAWSRFTGTVLPGAVLWFTDDNIPKVGTSERTQIIVSAPDVAIVLAEAPPFLGVFRETFANVLEAVWFRCSSTAPQLPSRGGQRHHLRRGYGGAGLAVTPCCESLGWAAATSPRGSRARAGRSGGRVLRVSRRIAR